VSATTAAVTFNLEPVFAAAWAFVLTGQRLDLQGLLGAAAVLAGMLMAALAPGEAEVAAPAQGSMAATGTSPDEV